MRSGRIGSGLLVSTMGLSGGDGIGSQPLSHFVTNRDSFAQQADPAADGCPSQARRAGADRRGGRGLACRAGRTTPRRLTKFCADARLMRIKVSTVGPVKITV
jgi:hypothetical protein